MSTNGTGSLPPSTLQFKKPGGLGLGRLQSSPADPIPTARPKEQSDAFEPLRGGMGRLVFGEKVYPLNRSDILDKGKIGNGVTGEVYKVLHKSTGQLMAAKKMVWMDENEERKRVLMDLNVMSIHKCPHIVTYYGSTIWNNEVWVFMELMGTCLQRLFNKVGGPIPEDIVCKMSVSIVKALHYLKTEHKVIHRDVKPSNMLLDRKGNVKLCDFGISGRLVDSQAFTRNAGCAAFMAPERINLQSEGGYDIRADIWSLGISLAQLVTGTLPYSDRNFSTEFELLTHIVQAPPPLPNIGDFSPEFYSFLSQCLTKDVLIRPHYEELLGHPLIKEYEIKPVDVGAWVRGIDDMMGQNESTFKRTYSDTVSQLSSVQLGEITARFNELYAKAGGAKGLVVDREAFSRYLNLPVAIGDRLFEAFDEKKNGSICFEEFVCGLAIVLHGSFRERCGLLFRVFNIGNDEGVSREELRTMLTAILQSTNTILYTVGHTNRAVLGGEDMQETITAMVEAAFTNCDISRTGKLLPVEFEYWLKRNPKILDTLLSFKTQRDECTLGSLIMSPSEQKLSDNQHSPRRAGGSLDPLPIGASPVGGGSPFQSNTKRDSTVSSSSSSLQSVSMETSLLLTQQTHLETVTESGGGGGVSQGCVEKQAVSQVALDIDSEEAPPPLVPEANRDTGSHEDNDVQVPMDGPGSAESVSFTLGLGNDEGANGASSDPTDGQVGLDMEHVDGAGDTGETGLTGSLDSAQGSSIMASIAATSIMTSDLTSDLSIAIVPRVQQLDQLGPSSPVLPVQEEEELVLGGAPLPISSEIVGEKLDIGVGDMVMEEEGEGEGGGVTYGVGVSETKPLTGDPVFTAATPPEPHPPMATPPQAHPSASFPGPATPPKLHPPVATVPPHSPSTRVYTRSPFPELEEVEGSKVSESISQAWVLNNWTRDLLDNRQLGTHLTCPALMTDIKLTDGISELLASHYPDRPRKAMLSVERVSMDSTGLRRLVSSGSLHAALELTARFLSAHGQGLGQAGQPTIHTHKTLQMWSTRLSLLMYLKLYKEAEIELRPFGEMLNPDLYYQYHTHSYPGRKGSLIPFTLRLLHANLPRHVGDAQLALDRLCRLQSVCEQVLVELDKGHLPEDTEPLSDSDLKVALGLWKERLFRTKCCIANTLIFVHDYGMAVRLYEEVAVDQTMLIRTEILSGIGRLYLQIGDLSTATSYFNRVQSERGDQNSLVKLNEGYLNVFMSRWQTARDCFESALTFDPSSIVIKSNITVCTFYMGRLKESIGDMEVLLTSDPPSSLQPSLFANLATTYELESGNSFLKKLAYLPLLAQHIGQGYQHLTQLNMK